MAFIYGLTASLDDFQLLWKMSVIPNSQFTPVQNSTTNNIHTNNVTVAAGNPVIANNFVSESQVLDKKR